MSQAAKRLLVDRVAAVAVQLVREQVGRGKRVEADRDDPLTVDGDELERRGLVVLELEIVPADSELKPDVATRRANDLLLSEKVDFLAVNTGSNIAKAVSQVASQAKKVFFATGAEASELTGEEFFDTSFRCCLNTDMHSAELAIYFAKMTPQKYTKFYLLNEDYNFGRAAADGFKKKFNKIKAANQTIVGDEYHPLQKVQDFAPYITKIMASGAEIVMTGDWGQDLKLFLQQGAALGWKVKVGNYFLDDPLVMQTVGKAGVGHITADAYLSTVDTKENHEFIKAWRARYPDAPISYKYPTLTCARVTNATIWVGDVIKRAGSLDTDKLIKAWEGSKFKTVWGAEAEMRACDHQMLTQGYGILKATSTEDGKQMSSIEVTSLERGTPPDAAFAPPPGYTEKNKGDMMGHGRRP